MSISMCSFSAIVSIRVGVEDVSLLLSRWLCFLLMATRSCGRTSNLKGHCAVLKHGGMERLCR